MTHVHNFSIYTIYKHMYIECTRVCLLQTLVHSITLFFVHYKTLTFINMETMTSPFGLLAASV